MITFKKIDENNEAVFEDNKRAGTIKKVKNGWKYFSNNTPVF